MKLAIFTTTAIALFGAAVAAPVHKDTGIVQRDVNVLGVHLVLRDDGALPAGAHLVPRDDGALPAYEGAQYATHAFVKKADSDVNDLRLRDKVTPKLINRAPQDIPAETPVKSDGSGGVVPYPKRQNQDEPIPAEVAVKSDGNGGIVVYVKRQGDVIPAEVAVKSDGTSIQPY